MVGQPKTEHVAKKFVWCQWDAGNQQLFYLHLRHHGNEDKQPLLSCLQFYSGAQHDAVVGEDYILLPLNTWKWAVQSLTFKAPNKNCSRRLFNL